MSMSIIRRPLQYLTQAITKKIPGYDNLIGEEDEAAQQSHNNSQSNKSMKKFEETKQKSGTNVFPSKKDVTASAKYKQLLEGG